MPARNRGSLPRGRTRRQPATQLRQSFVRGHGGRSPASGSSGSGRTTALTGLRGPAHHSAPPPFPAPALPPRRNGARSHAHTGRCSSAQGGREPAAPLSALPQPGTPPCRAVPCRASTGNTPPAPSPGPPCHPAPGRAAGLPHARISAHRHRALPAARGPPQKPPLRLVETAPPGGPAGSGSACEGAGGRVCVRFPPAPDTAF